MNETNFLFTSGCPSIFHQGLDYGIKQIPRQLPIQIIQSLEHFFQTHLPLFSYLQQNHIAYALVAGFYQAKCILGLVVHLDLGKDHVARQNLKITGNCLYLHPLDLPLQGNLETTLTLRLCIPSSANVLQQWALQNVEDQKPLVFWEQNTNQMLQQWYHQLTWLDVAVQSQIETWVGPIVVPKPGGSWFKKHFGAIFLGLCLLLTIVPITFAAIAIVTSQKPMPQPKPLPNQAVPLTLETEAQKWQALQKLWDAPNFAEQLSAIVNCTEFAEQHRMDMNKIALYFQYLQQQWPMQWTEDSLQMFRKKALREALDQSSIEVLYHAYISQYRFAWPTLPKEKKQLWNVLYVYARIQVELAYTKDIQLYKKIIAEYPND